ncbi:MAG: YdjY domain-containing protein [Phycisphaerae bacterium]
MPSSRLPRLIPASIVLCTLTCFSIAQETGEPQQKGITQYARGVRIDWTRPRVEVKGRVVLREGLLELFACSPRTREHESIVVVEAQPLRIFQALGLAGLTSGRPITLDRDSGTWRPATGDTVRIEVSWRYDGKQHTADIGTWMTDVSTERHPPPGIWRFAGSARDKDGAFMADVDGTVICVVDFPSALIAIGELKSADNSALWVRADTGRIPPIGTPVTLLFSPVKPGAKPPEKSTVDRSPRTGNSEHP